MTRPESIAVVGGMGAMGSMVARFFREGGYHVEIADRAAGPVSWASIARHDAIVIAVPMRALQGVLAEMGPHTRREGVVIDITSLKSQPVQWMLQYCSGEIVGAHPLFGPHTISPAGHTVFLCPARGRGWFSWFRSFLEDMGVHVVEMDPVSHDRLMARAQVLRHLLLTCFGRSLELLDFDMESDLPLCGPWFGRLVDLLRYQFRQSPALYSEIALSNPHTSEVTDALQKAFGEVSALCRSQDRDGLERFMGDAAALVRPEDLP